MNGSMWATTLASHPYPLLQWGTVLGASLLAAVSDVRTRRIPNRLTSVLVATGFVSSAFWGGVGGGLDALAACVLLAFPYFLLFAFAGGGAGDAKLMGAIGAWLGLLNGALVLVAVSLAGLVLGFVQAAQQRRCGVVVASVIGLARGMAACLFARAPLSALAASLPPTHGSKKMPFGLAICAGVALSAFGVLSWRIS